MRIETLRRKSAASIISTRTADSVFMTDTTTPVKPPPPPSGYSSVGNDYTATENGFVPELSKNRVEFGSVADTIDVNDSVSMQKRKVRRSEDNKSTSTSVDLEEDFDMWYVAFYIILATIKYDKLSLFLKFSIYLRKY